MVPRLLLILLLLAAGCSAVKKKIYIGQYFKEHLSPRDKVTMKNGGSLPSWLIIKHGLLQGVPTEHDVGDYYIHIESRMTPNLDLELSVVEEGWNVCGSNETYWIEAIYSYENNVTNRVQAAVEIGLSTDINGLRIYNGTYSRELRNVDVLSDDINLGTFAVVWDVACGDDMDTAFDRLDVFIDEDDGDYDYTTMTKGRYRKEIPVKIEPTTTTTTMRTTTRKARVRTTTPKIITTTEIERTTRSIHDNKPVRLNSLPVFNCVRGEICDLTIPEATFQDPEDGGTYKLRLSIVSLDNAEVWMNIDNGNTRMTGVPLQIGEYSYRLEARDHIGQMVSAPFSVIVKPSAPTNHVILLELDSPSIGHLTIRPYILGDFVRNLARALHADSASFTVRDVTVAPSNKTLISWSNNTIAYKICDENALQAMASKMIMKQKMRTKTEFVKAMGNHFYVRRATLVRQGSCVSTPAVEAITTVPTVSASQDSQLPWYMWIIGILVFLLVIAIAYIIYSICTNKNNKKKQRASTEYVGKGLPVVFPDEVDEGDPTNAGTPMLAREERPPLKVSQHENPLYKPPTQTAAASPRVTPTGGSPNQKQPPPYIAP
ncbi:unnamed protein product [Caenorhabditis auriculariae]|uniref:Dystroglycan 1 n=1 Tax=Caenorhabditis auriculariae TaxID=2777116 RepID=A0A8S1GRC9_9PELO|nr:unnamed protein product [Caenorhabditis auriculariae]